LSEYASLLGSPVELDSENNISSEVTSTCSMTQLELPMPERLLPIGPHSKASIPCLVEKVRQALGMPTGAECAAGQGKNSRSCPQVLNSSTCNLPCCNHAHELFWTLAHMGEERKLYKVLMGKPQRIGTS